VEKLLSKLPPSNRDSTAPKSAGTYKFVNGARVLVNPNSVRERFIQKEKQLLEARERATVLGGEVEAPGLIKATERMQGEDLDDVVDLPDFSQAADGGEGFAGYQRIQRGDLCELRWVRLPPLEEGGILTMM
jgi:hypothetical protein